MMSKYASGRSFDYMADNTPRGRRFILENYEPIQAKSTTSRSETHPHQVSPQRNTDYKVRHTFDDNEYLNIAEAKSVSSKQTSNSVVTSPLVLGANGGNTAASSNVARTNHVGQATAIQPTGNVTYRGRNKRTQRVAISNVSPRKPLFIDTPPPQSPVMTKGKQTNAVSPRKDGNKKGKNDNKKGKKGAPPGKGDKEQETGIKEKGGLSARDQYMIGLYDGEITHLKPSQVRYTHDEIVSHFQDGKPLIKTFKALLYGRVKIRCGEHDVPPIEVMHSDDLWFVVNGNRRLFVFKHLQRCGALPEMQVLVRRYDALVMDSHFSTRTMGRSIMLVNDGRMEEKMKEQVRQWKEWKLNRSNQKHAPKKKGNPPAQQKQDENKSSSCCTIS